MWVSVNENHDVSELVKGASAVWYWGNRIQQRESGSGLWQSCITWRVDLYTLRTGRVRGSSRGASSRCTSPLGALKLN